MSEEMLLAPPGTMPDFVQGLVNLADASLGAMVLSVSDEFFAPGERMLNPEAPVFYPQRYDEHGKWMDGWESRRRRGPGHDWAVIRLALPGQLRGVDMDTQFFTGNYPLAASLEACFSPEQEPDARTLWTTVVPATPLQGNSHHWQRINHAGIFTHLRLNLLPDGGMARLRVYGVVHVDSRTLPPDTELELSGLMYGGREVAWNDSHYGTPMNLLKPGRGRDMGDGWETRRRREPGFDWCILRLGLTGTVTRIEIDTAHFKGNYPQRFSLQAALLAEDQPAASIVAQSQFWPVLLDEQPLSADAVHAWIDGVQHLGSVNYLRLNIVPDGGISRLRAWGKVDAGSSH